MILILASGDPPFFNQDWPYRFILFLVLFLSVISSIIYVVWFSNSKNVKNIAPRMNNSPISTYCILVCYSTMLAIVASSMFLAYNLIVLAKPQLGLESHQKRYFMTDNYDHRPFVYEREKIEEKSQEEKSEIKKKEYQDTLAVVRSESTSTILISLVVLVVSAIAYLIHFLKLKSISYNKAMERNFE